MTACFWTNLTLNVAEDCMLPMYAFSDSYEYITPPYTYGGNEGFITGAYGRSTATTNNMVLNNIAISGDTAIVGSHYGYLTTVPPSGTHGVVFIFEKVGATWPIKQVVISEPHLNGSFFGADVDIDGDYFVGSAMEDNTGGFAAGCTHVFYRSGGTWAHQQQIVRPGAAASDYQSACAISGDYILIGAHQADPGALSGAGQAHVYLRSGATWNLQQSLVASDTKASGHFGFAVELITRDGIDTAFIAARNYNETVFGYTEGAIYVFTRSGTVWTEQQKIETAVEVNDQRFGHCVTARGDTMIANSQQGTHVFLWNGSTWVEDQILSGTGQTSRIWATSISDDEQFITGGGWWEGEYQILSWYAGQGYSLASAQPISEPGRTTLGKDFDIPVAQSGNNLIVGIGATDNSNNYLAQEINFFELVP